MFFPGIDLAPKFFAVENAKPINSLQLELLKIRKAVGKFTLWYDFSTPINGTVHKCVTAFLQESGIKVN